MLLYVQQTEHNNTTDTETQSSPFWLLYISGLNEAFQTQSEAGSSSNINLLIKDIVSVRDDCGTSIYKLPSQYSSAGFCP